MNAWGEGGNRGQGVLCHVISDNVFLRVGGDVITMADSSFLCRLFSQREHRFFVMVDIKVSKGAKMSKLRGLGVQVGHVEEVVDFSGFGSRWPRCPSYF